MTGVAGDRCRALDGKEGVYHPKAFHRHDGSPTGYGVVEGISMPPLHGECACVVERVDGLPRYRLRREPPYLLRMLEMKTGRQRKNRPSRVHMWQAQAWGAPSQVQPMAGHD
jgi:hypothetical protein